MHPETRAKDLSRAQLSEIRRAMGFVVETACRAGADAELFPSDWLFHHRWGKVAGKVGGKPISFITVGGRTTAFVAAVQKKGDASAAKAKARATSGGHRGGEKNSAEEVKTAAPPPKRESAAGGEGHSRSQESGAGETASASEEGGAAESGAP